RLPEGFRREALNTEEDIEEICLHHGINERRLPGQIHGCLGVEHHRTTPRLLPFFELHAKIKSPIVITDEVVINNKYLLLPSQAEELVEFCHQLLRVLGARLSPVQDNDVAEFTLKRTSP